MALQRGAHRVDVVGCGEQHDGGRALRHVGPHLVDERIVELGTPACETPPIVAPPTSPAAKPGGPKNAPTTAPVNAPSTVRFPIGSLWSTTST